ncbi:hypothetical protein L204_100452 [Cryptococcus depauperatus]
METFFSGAAMECGPSNAVKALARKTDVDRAIQQDRLVSSHGASASKSPFTSHTHKHSLVIQHAQPTLSEPFDLSSLKQHLSPTLSSVPGTSQSHNRTVSWAQEFPQQFHAQDRLSNSSPNWINEFAGHTPPPKTREQAISTQAAGPAPWETSHLQRQQRPQNYVNVPFDHLTSSIDHPPFQRHFNEHPQGFAVADNGKNSSTNSETFSEPQDLLALTARSFAETMDNDSTVLSQNPKLKQSKFMSLVRGIGNGNIVMQERPLTQNEDIVSDISFVMREENGLWLEQFRNETAEKQDTKPASGTPSHTHVRVNYQSSPYPQGEKNYPALSSWAPLMSNASPSPYIPSFQNGNSTNNNKVWEEQFRDQEAIVQSTISTREEVQAATEYDKQKSVHFAHSTLEKERSTVPDKLEEALASNTSIPGSGWGWSEAGLTDDIDEEVFAHFNGQINYAHSDMGGGVGKHEEWAQLQNGEEQLYKNTPTKPQLRGMRLGENSERYLFHAKNPYAANRNEVIHEMLIHDSPTMKSVLELEARVQEIPTSHEAWYTLGLKQQENEREDQAILALSKVIQIEPTFRPAYLALAVSYTNENEGEAACTMLDRWINLGQNDQQFEAITEPDSRSALIERLINIARRNPSQIDADVQVALGVLFNMVGGEDYMKAEDCFSAALAVRPNDWLLFNRLGATLANSGRSNEAIHYYNKALLLHPNFVRARFNLGISYMNLGQYPAAAQAIIDALRLQHADASEAYGFETDGKRAKGVTTESLWNNLRSACFYMNRQDLIKSIDERDLASMPLNFVDER